MFGRGRLARISRHGPSFQNLEKIRKPISGIALTVVDGRIVMLPVILTSTPAAALAITIGEKERLERS